MTTPFRRCVLLVILTAGVLSAADPPRSTSESVRATVKKLWSNKPDEVGTAYERLEADPLALPVLRIASVTDPDVGHRGVLERLVRTAEKGRDPELANRIERWAADGRIDLLIEVRTSSDGKAADAALTALIDAGQNLRRAGEDIATAHLPKSSHQFLGRLPGPDRAAFDKSKVTLQFDAEITLPEKRQRDRLALFADRLRVPTNRFDRSILVARSELDATPIKDGCWWTGCLLFANAPFPLGRASGCVVVVDGDLDLSGPEAGGAGSVLVVNGDVRGGGGERGPAISGCVVWATGDIRLKPNHTTGQSVYQAAGTVDEPDGMLLHGRSWSNVKEPPLPVRFLDPAADYGLTLEATKGGMKVTKVTEKSAFAEVLKAGDVISAVTGVKTPTAPAFRREFRRGVVEGAVLLDVVRGKETLELLVPVPDVPTAPKKDKEPKATPPEKK